MCMFAIAGCGGNHLIDGQWIGIHMSTEGTNGPQMNFIDSGYGAQVFEKCGAMFQIDVSHENHADRYIEARRV